MTTFSLSKVYSFNTTAPSILGTVVKNAKLLGIVDYETACMYSNIPVMHKQIYPLLPSNTPDTPASYTYYLFASESGEKVVYADKWIDINTATIVEGINVQVNVNNISLTDIDHIRDSLNALGYTDYTIKQI